MATISQATIDDVPTLIQIHTSAFKTDMFSNLMLLNRPENAHQNLMQKSINHWFSDPQCQIIKAEIDGRIVGWACWILKEADDAPIKKQESSLATKEPKKEIPSAPQDPSQVLGGIMHKEMMRWKEELLTSKSERYMVLQALATDPALQGRGIGTRLVQRGADKADEDGLICWAHASPSGHGLYRRVGFEELAKSDFDLAKWAPGGITGGRGWGIYTFRYMVRPAKKLHKPS